jgi:hypothetical protein
MTEPVPLRQWLHDHDLVLSHPGHGHNETDFPVMFSTLERLDKEWAVVPRQEES